MVIWLALFALALPYGLSRNYGLFTAFFAPLVGLILFHTGVGELFLAERNHVIGLFVGPVVLAVAYTLLTQWLEEREYS